MFKLNDFAAVIFDMDGLVLDTETTYFKAWQAAASHMGFALPWDCCQDFSGLHYQAIEQKLLGQFGADFGLSEFSQLSGQYWREYVQVHGINTRPGFSEFIQQVQQARLPYALATNSRAVNAYECLDLAGLNQVFPVVLTRDDVQYGKPDPALFLQAAAYLQVDIGQCLVLEDSLSGIQAAANAGAFSVYIPSTASPDPQAEALCQLMVADLLALVCSSQSSQL